MRFFLYYFSLIWAISLGAKTGILAPKMLWKCHCCKRNTNINKEDMAMNTFNNKKTFTIHSIQSIKKALQLLGMNKYMREIEYLYQKRNNIIPPRFLKA